MKFDMFKEIKINKIFSLPTDPYKKILLVSGNKLFILSGLMTACPSMRQYTCMLKKVVCHSTTTSPA